MLDENILLACTGCSACKCICPNNCIVMKPDEKGFLYPTIENTSKCTGCKLCTSVCPIYNSIEINDISTKTIAYAAYSLDDEIRMNSSSGGLFTELATYVLNNDGIVFGAAYDKEFVVIHRGVKTLNELSILRGAKYSQSNLNDTFLNIKKLLKADNWILFSGTPCQVAGLKSYLKKEYEKLICVDFVCHSVPSPLVWEKYVKYRSEKDNKGKMPIKINLRSKHTGWSHYQYSNVYQYRNGKKYTQLSGNDVFMNLFVGNYINRDSCADCKFKGYERISDITIADFWGIWDIDPDMDDNKGTSLVLLHSSKGKQLFNAIQNNIRKKGVSLDEASRYNMSILRSSKKNENYELIWRLIHSEDFDAIKKVICTKKKKSTFENIKSNLYSLIKHIIKL